MIRQLFTAHPNSVGESYAEHMRVALGFGARMIAGGLACLVHAVLPFLFVRTGSMMIAQLNETMVRNRHRAPVPANAAPATFAPAASGQKIR